MIVELNDKQALALEQILETVQQVYHNIGHDEWSVHGEDACNSDDAESAVEDILVMLQCS